LPAIAAGAEVTFWWERDRFLDAMHSSWSSKDAGDSSKNVRCPKARLQFHYELNTQVWIDRIRRSEFRVILPIDHRDIPN